MINRLSTLACALLGAGLCLTVAPPASAQQSHGRNFEYRSQVGAWTIRPIYQSGRFSRCAADLRGSSGVLRFAYFPNGNYYLSWPSTTGGVTDPSLTMLYFDRGYRVMRMSNRSNRPSIQLDSTMIDNLFRANETIGVQQNMIRRDWPLYGQDMTDVFVEMENCTHKYAS
ncbi:hypothetical protein [Sphingosinithalassobacter portus]|uniref:hypothetical protein n=1 Tax=Stakelama portus TaxID=2676234 RepID=UPI0011AB7731|nr:hypothetical protein [Sphingosinithalassobacter portus]